MRTTVWLAGLGALVLAAVLFAQDRPYHPGEQFARPRLHSTT